MDAPNPAHAPKAVKGFLGHRKPIVYVLMAAGVIAIGLYLRKRNQNQGEQIPTVDGTGDMVDAGAGYPGTTQGAASSDSYSDPGAYGGYPSPDLNSFFDELSNLLATTSSNQEAPSVPDTGGGITVNPSATAVHSAPPATGTTSPTVSPYPKYPYHDTRGWYRLVLPPDGSRWHYYGPSDSPKVQVQAAQTAPAKTTTTTSPGFTQTGAVATGILASPTPTSTLVSPYGSKYPYHSDRGWYRLVLPPDGTRWHYYGPSDSPKIRVA